MKKMEFSKKILVVTFGIAVVIIAYAMFVQMLVILKDYHGGTGFYYWKAKRENELKLKKKFGELYEQEQETTTYQEEY
mgnify:CR=1 FL=1